ncbi:tRNA lysidine(34) synthetase TilS [Buchnera aphidicola]|uniref:tRNA(Ile)-lysidine synthase n=1 Tax=Buchnera aphidicola subsp. Melaphis rhois TaxID=118103 RepID=A0A4D6YA34_BUCMH|nr:tRNA lysidine(34) synthetase TilS [Buchnera aphidicola]QCI23141.1 tRNA lysidine(34) synthetase TilS [Buchnera aphidicola (Melaphis rhois)]
MITKYIKKISGLSFLLAYSGGLDSTFLFYQLLKAKKVQPKLKFRAIHINHQLNKNSNEWNRHCRQVCEKHNITLIEKKTIINKKKLGIEAAARLKRYEIICNEALPTEIILTAHNLNDQCETLFLALKRGSGITGLSGMSYKSKLFNKYIIIRPLLNIDRSEIQSWISKNNIHWIEDTSNYDTTYDRNFLRHKILPLFTKRWPNFIEKCATSTCILKKEKSILDQILEKKLNKYLICNSILNITDFAEMKSEIRYSLLRKWIQINNYTAPSYKIIKAIYYEVILSKPDSKAKVKVNNQEIKRYKQNLYFVKIVPCIKNLILMWYPPWNYLKLPNNLGFIIQNKFGIVLPVPKKNEIVNIRFQTSGKVLIQGNPIRKKIKKIWQEHKINPWNRTNIPLLFYNNTLISALGIFNVIHDDRKQSEHTWTLSWINNIHN